jgi:hypothetical protein
MKNIMLVALAMLPSIVVLAAESEQPCLVVSVTDVGKNTTHKVVSREEYNALQADIVNRNRLLPKAIQLAKKDWEADESTKRKSFPASVVSEAKIKTMGPFKTRADAESKVAALEKTSEDSGKKSSEEKQLALLRQNLARAQNTNNPDYKTINNLKTEIANHEKNIERRKTMQEARDSLEESVRSSITAKLDELAGGKSK